MLNGSIKITDQLLIRYEAHNVFGTDFKIPLRNRVSLLIIKLYFVLSK